MGFLDDLILNSSNRLEDNSSIDFFRNRHISIDACRKARVGYVDVTTDAGQDPFNDHSECDLNKCDYCRFNAWFYKDRECRFHNHVLFPLTDFKNRVVGLSLRGIDKKSFESFILRRDSNAVLFKTSEGTRKIYEANAVYITEGPMDLLSLIESGIDNSLAIMTNNMSQNQIKWINRVSDNYYLAMDQDEAGNMGANNAKRKLGENNCARIKWNEFPKCKDLNDLLLECGPVRLKKIVLGAEL